jgi:hypothetical protein
VYLNLERRKQLVQQEMVGQAWAQKCQEATSETAGSEYDAPQAACISAYDGSDLNLPHDSNYAVCLFCGGHFVGTTKLPPCLVRM